MEEALLDFLGRTQRKSVSLRGHTLSLHLLTAQQLLEIKRSAARLDTEDEEERALRANAELLAHSLFLEDKPVFDSGDAVLETLSAEEMHSLLNEFFAWTQCANPSAEGERRTVEILKKA